MNRKVLIAYFTNSGSTAEVAEKIGEVIRAGGLTVDVRSARDVTECSGYDAVILGAPMIMGWHRGAVRFARRFQRQLASIRVAYFMTALTLTDVEDAKSDAVNLFVDPHLLKEPAAAGRLSFKERHTTLAAYLGPVMRKTFPVSPFSIALFGGKLDYRKLRMPQMLFVMLVVGARPGDFRDWKLIEGWSRDAAQAIQHT